MRSLGRPAVWGFAGLSLVCVAGAVFAGYQRIFSCFAAYDDEGYVMVSLRSFLEGHPLYVQTYSQYGPGYYWVQALIHDLTGWSVTHDITRGKTLTLWVTVSMLSMLFVYRVTACRVAALLGFLLSFFHLERLSMEPGHPQGLCTLATVGCLVVASYVPIAGCRNLLFAVMGGATAVLAMTKINVGVFVLTANSLAILTLIPGCRQRRGLLVIWLGFALLLPSLVLGRNLVDLSVLALAALAVTSLLASLWVACQATPWRPLTIGNLVGYWTGFAGACVGLAGITLLHGTTAHGLLDGLVLQHRDFGTTFAGPFLRNPAVPPTGSLLAAVGLAVAARSAAGAPAITRWVRFLCTVGLVAVCLRHAVESWLPLLHGGQDRGFARLITTCFLPLVWIVLVPRQGGADAQRTSPGNQTFARLALCATASLQLLATFPCPGTQLAMSSLGVLLAMLVAVADQLPAQARFASGDWFVRRAPVLLAFAAALVTLGLRGGYQWDARERMEPLGLPGAQHLRLPPAEVLEKRWLVGQLQTHADTFVHLRHGYNSLYFWTDLPPPTGWNTTLWPQLLSAQKQEEVLRSLLAHRRPCVIVPASVLLPGRTTADARPALANPTNSRLVEYIGDHFVPRWKRGDVEIWRQAMPEQGAANSP